MNHEVRDAPSRVAGLPERTFVVATAAIGVLRHALGASKIGYNGVSRSQWFGSSEF